MSITISSALSWMRQPSTITGLSALSAAAAGVLTGQMSATAAVPVLAFGAVAILLPDNSAARTDASKLATDAVSLSRTGGSANQVAPVVQDIAALAADLQPASGGKAAG